MLEIILGVLILGWLLYQWWIMPYTYWKRKGMPHLESTFPFGTSPELAKLNEYSGYTIRRLYNQIGDDKYAGIFIIRRPNLIIKDLEIIKSVMVKDFVYFTDRINVDNMKEPLSHHLFNLGGDKWKALRVKMTPTFTSGKLKLMFPLFEHCSRNLEEILEKIVSSQEDIDVKDIMGRYTTKIVGTCAYGLDIDSLGNQDNEFVKITRTLFSRFPMTRKLIFGLTMVFPGIEKVLKPTFLPKKDEQFLTTVVEETMAHRMNVSAKRNDFIDLLMEIREHGTITVDSIEKSGNVKTSVDITDMDLVAQVFVFLAAGFETSSSVTSYCLFELAENPDVQEKLRKEILAQPPTYQSIQEMVYLDMVVNETMRKYPTLPLLTRKCTKQYQLPDGNTLDKGTRVIIPVYALHHDPNYFPNPSKFDPERFNQENKKSRPQHCFLPFGEGPRICIGMRFGLLQTKMGIATILAKYRVEKTPNTISPLQVMPSPLITCVKHPIKLAFKPL